MVRIKFTEVALYSRPPVVAVYDLILYILKVSSGGTKKAMKQNIKTVNTGNYKLIVQKPSSLRDGKFECMFCDDLFLEANTFTCCTKRIGDLGRGKILVT